MKAIILAAGEGKRLQPLTKNTPKCMIKLFGKSLLEWKIDVFRDCGITDVSIVTGYKSELIKYPYVNYYHNEKFNSTNMVETLFCAKDKLYDSVIVSYGDIIFEKTVLKKLISSKDDFSIIIDKKWQKYWKIRTRDVLKDVESLKIDNNGYLLDIGQKVLDEKEIEGQYIGLMKFQNQGINVVKDFYEKTKKIAEKGKNPLNPNLPFEKSFMTDFLRGLINAGCKLKAVFVSNGWLELDTIHDYSIYEKMYVEETLSEFINLTDMKT